ncbi:H-NS histone family protein [Delftia acidovorans]|uniref:H-NS histone family protein n=1 Tax=Delftia acidovorans TaxID=80866 RepID=UPI0005047A33|nr:H-NS histone family protein [Delftia acidovorans]KFJ10147.1 H-NS histone family protein [Delftia acidovorans]QQB52242.1 H-NS histone family protein [Delftia acidovorans]
MNTYQLLLAQRDALDARIATEFNRLRQDSIDTVKQLCTMYSISAADVFSAAKPKANVGQPKYRDPATGATWTGRGKPPNWINGKDRAPFLIATQ